MNLNKSKKNIVITGAGSGIGRETAEFFLKRGHQVALIGRNRKSLSSAAKKNKNAIILPCDISKHKKVKDTFLKIYKQWKRIDVLFNNAGVSSSPKLIDEIPTKEWQETLEINIMGSFFCSREAFKIMRNQRPLGGRIINNGSVSAYSPRPLSSAYTTSKHAITGLTKSISLEGRKFNIACSQIDIGNTESNLTKKMKKGIIQANGLIQKEPVFETKYVAKTIHYIAELPLDVNVQFITLMATKMPFIGRG